MFEHSYAFRQPAFKEFLVISCIPLAKMPFKVFLFASKYPVFADKIRRVGYNAVA
jgi:hypothetical protein